MCGRNIGKETSSTIGVQRRTNYALKTMSKAEFIKMMTTDLPEAPAYFARDAEINRAGAAPLEELPRPAALLPEAVNKMAQQDYLILDVRPAAAFGNGHISGAINIGLGGQFASWAGSLISADSPLVIVADDLAGVDEAVMRLARVGIEKVKGYLSGGMYEWDKAELATASIPQMPVDELHNRMTEQTDLQIIDVRRPAEYADGHVPGAASVPLAQLEKESGGLDRQRPTAIICASGYRSSAATSLLARRGFTDLFNVVGGTSGWIGAGYPVEQTQTEAVENQ
jgi:rhodanese-related sulfurtransferase